MIRYKPVDWIMWELDGMQLLLVRDSNVVYDQDGYTVTELWL